MNIAVVLFYRSFLAAIVVAILTVGIAEVSPAQAATCPATFTRFRSTYRTFSCYCPANRTRQGSVWGSGIYTDDSSICRAARHAGAISWRGGNVTVRGVRGRNGYRGSTRNGVSTRNYGRWHWSFTVAGGGSGGGGGNTSLTCRYYAQTAVRQNNRNLRQRCGYGGRRWQSNYQAHYNWCLRASAGWRNSETNARSSALRRCVSGRVGCRNYAQTAVNQNNRNLRQRCGYRGARWQSNYRVHYNWCLRAGIGQRNAETNIRNAALRRCTGGGNLLLRCRKYARTAVDQNIQNLRRRCGYRGLRWQSNYRAHYNWCRRVSAGRSNIETNSRSIALRRCRGGSGLFRSRWDKIAGPGGGWTTGWVPNHTQRVCGHQARGCNCFGRNYCGNYRSGQTTIWWPRGCRGPRWVIRCTSVPQ